MEELCTVEPLGLNNRRSQLIRVLFTIILIGLPLLFSCSKESGNGVQGTENIVADSTIIPDIGDTKEFIDSIFTESGVEIGTSTVSITDSMTVTINGKAEVAYHWTWFNEEAGEFYDFSALYGYSEFEGVYWLGGIGPIDTVIIKSQYLKYPVLLGEVWDSYVLGYNKEDSTFLISDTIQISCMSLKTPFYTPSGAIDAYQYHYQKPDKMSNVIDVYVYFSPEYGQLGYEHYKGAQRVLKKVLFSNN